MLICRLSRRLFMVFPEETGPRHDYVFCREVANLTLFQADPIIAAIQLGQPWRHLLPKETTHGQ